ncbi:hypothetical protein [Nitrosophilus kaiyonis]|uniref:hypothetical protein n=1 Tax=Nitrosophilus kaiyonis TaxID=2930200 RepID=UPI002492C714|nr:hypothetical protein [Nitrosophilus kaiyonis]
MIDKKKEKYERLKYIRELEKFTNRIYNFLNQENITKKDFKEYVDKIFKNLENIKKVILKSEYLTSLEKFVEKSANLPNSSKNINEIKEEITYEANRLRKLKRVKSYQKEKHKKRAIDNE